jgi:AraC family transcriptional regulator, positive regulator of tynA and feaB
MRGKTVMKHILEERLRRAAWLLASSEARHHTISEIAFACGFNDASHFGRVFAEHWGKTPSEWRKQAL